MKPFDLVVPVSSWVPCLVLPGTQQKGWKHEQEVLETLGAVPVLFPEP